MWKLNSSIIKNYAPNGKQYLCPLFPIPLVNNIIFYSGKNSTSGHILLNLFSPLPHFFLLPTTSFSHSHCSRPLFSTALSSLSSFSPSFLSTSYLCDFFKIILPKDLSSLRSTESSELSVYRKVLIKLLNFK